MKWVVAAAAWPSWSRLLGWEGPLIPLTLIWPRVAGDGIWLLVDFEFDSEFVGKPDLLEPERGCMPSCGVNCSCEDWNDAGKKLPSKTCLLSMSISEGLPLAASYVSI